ncbi:protein-glutamine gamma-glutamyltransferase [Caldisalinibacter kiritimatiensis]|uniref:Protein-glutamine gamma-glutamyltransferase n=1 Tax=Caldisalinibacter kiritimatiensis TaxID=1304284 RepID=R1CT20_9FIRM|nr:protein-glutamine gamma-glutamyltransferase [Caldisalinibacter kiritimatiensis]EOD01796.1 Protein-glutamine gamma-glutamyltransferase [Caldisalinibacter kiritimatiensis]
MIKISGSELYPTDLIRQYPPRSDAIEIIRILSTSNVTYNYDSIDQLKFEIQLRINIIKASTDLNRSRFSFRTFRKSICNPEFWERTNNGGFLSKEGISSWDAINDIYINSSMYGTECASAIVIVFYKAVTDIYPKKLFDRIFPTVYIMNWHHIDKDLGVRTYRDINDYLPGDCRYIKNPDVDPETPEWQGENVIDLGNGYFYGHGIGIRTIKQMIRILNNFRRQGATESAYLMNSATRVDFKHLAKIYYNYRPS